MDIISWTPDLASGFDFIDEQHKELFGHINNFYNSLNKKPDKTTLTELFKKLNEYTLDHFATEEKIMEENGFPDLLTHKTDHCKLAKAINSFADLLEAGKLIVSIETVNYFKDWIIEHITISDRNYCLFISAKTIRLL